MNDVDTSRTTPVDLDRVMTRLDGLAREMAWLVERQKKTEELFAEMSPILKEVMSTATARLDELDKKGYFAFARELAKVGERVVEGFSPDDVHQLGDAVVGILETVRAMTQPQVLQIADEASEVLQKADQAQPLGIMGMVRATRDDDVQKGMAVMMEMMRHVGRAARAVTDHRQSSPEQLRRERLAAVLGPRKKKAVGVERPAPATVARVAAERAAGKPATPVAAVLDGVVFGADGHLADPKQWTEALAVKIAAAQSIELDAPRWALVRFARAEFEGKGVSPNIRRITQGADVATKDVYALFPKAPGRTIAKIAGIPKPMGCI